MKLLTKVRCTFLALKFEIFPMSKNTEKVYYAVGQGKETGIYSSWAECKAQTEGISNAKYRKFYSLEEAEEFVNFWKSYSSPIKGSEELVPDENNEKVREDKNSVMESAQIQETVSCHHCPTPCAYVHPPSSLSTLYDGKIDQKNLGVLAVNLRLDSFEKRLDSCLKEIGAITSEISHLKASVQDIKENFSCASVSGSPKKGRDGMLQTTLSFGNNISSKSPFKCTKEDSANLKDSDKNSGRSLKRKLSKTDFSDKSKRFADGTAATEDLLNRIKTESVDLTSFTVDEDGYVEVYTDGAAQFNGKEIAKAGIGIWFGDDHIMNVAEPVIGPPTNNTAEIQAARVAIQLAVKAGITKLKIITDSEFLINCATKWIHRWKKNGWILRDGGPVKNKIELQKLSEAASEIHIRWEKVAGHSGVKGNEAADRLANEGAIRYQR